VIFHLITILISYVLAGTAAYNVLLKTNFSIVLLAFFIIFSAAIIFLVKYIQYAISFLTLSKGGLLVVMVLVTMIISNVAHENYIDDWRYIGKPFLLGTVALGGGVNIMPVSFSNVKLSKPNVTKYIIACFLGFIFVWILNILWCFFMLQAIPQTGDPISLQNSLRNGEISTIPLIQIIESNYKDYQWIAYCVSVFILISVSVSYLTLGTGYRHVLDGFAYSWTYAMNQKPRNCFQSLYAKSARLSVTVKKAILYVIFFGIILIIAILNPKAFIIILERGSSLGLNMEALCLMWMCKNSKNLFTNLSIPISLDKKIFMIAMVIVFTYFSIAVIYDFVSLILEFLPTDFDYL